MRLRLLFIQRRQGVLDEAAALKALCLARLREFARRKMSRVDRSRSDDRPTCFPAR